MYIEQVHVLSNILYKNRLRNNVILLFFINNIKPQSNIYNIYVHNSLPIYFKCRPQGMHLEKISFYKVS